MNIRTRLTLQFTLLVSIIVLLTFLTIYYLRVRFVQEDFYARLEKKALTAAELLVKVSEVDSTLLKKIDQTNYDVFYQQNLAIYNYQNKEIYTSNDSVNYLLTPELLNQIRLENKVRFTEGPHKVVGLFYTDRYNRVISVAGAIDIVGENSLRSLRNILFGLFFWVVAVVAAAGWYFAGQALAPISSIIKHVKMLIPSQINQPLLVSNPNDEIGQLTQTFNELLSRIADTIRLQQLFISNVSHELKNPLMRIGTQLDVTMLKTRPVETYKQLMVSLRTDVREISQLTETLLELAKVSDDSPQVIFGAVRIDEILWDARALLIGAEPNYLITIDFGEEIINDDYLTASGNAQLLKTAFANLMENGCKFSEDAHVKVQLRYDTVDKRLCVSFCNTGEAIPPDELALIFQPFYRSRKTSHLKGYGVGLSLVERIIRLHNGQTTIESNKLNREIIFRVTIPTK